MLREGSCDLRLLLRSSGGSSCWFTVLLLLVLVHAGMLLSLLLRGQSELPRLMCELTRLCSFRLVLWPSHGKLLAKLAIPRSDVF